MTLSNVSETLKIVSIDAKDMRWPTSLGGHGSDAMVKYIHIRIKSFSIF